jgi:hypothetical protein
MKISIETSIKQADSLHVGHGKGWIMLWAPLDHLRYGVVEHGDLEDVAPHHFEGQEVADLDPMSNGKSSSSLTEEDNAFDIPELHHAGVPVLVLMIIVLGTVPR